MYHMCWHMHMRCNTNVCPCHCLVWHSWLAVMPWQLLWQKTLRIQGRWRTLVVQHFCMHVCIKAEELEVKNEGSKCITLSLSHWLGCPSKGVRVGCCACNLNEKDLIPYHAQCKTNTAHNCYWCKMACEQNSRFSGSEHIINIGKNLKVPSSTMRFVTKQSDKPLDRAARYMDRREVRSADIYTSMERERREQAHINIMRWAEGMTCRVDD